MTDQFQSQYIYNKNKKNSMIHMLIFYCERKIIVEVILFFFCLLL